MMNIALALLLAANLSDAGKHATIEVQSNGQAVVTIQERPGCHVEVMGGDVNNTVVFCDKRAKH
jgi:hypothetical protein